MGFSFNNDDDFKLNQEFLQDVDAQVEFHKEKFLTADVGLVDEVLKNAFISILEALPADSGEAIVPMLSAIGEAMIELRNKNEALCSELIEKKMPPPDDFQFN